MELRQLRYFVAVAEHLHYGRAAKQLHMAQPPLSQQIQRLEADLGVELFERTSRRVELTENGAQLVDAARRTLAEADHLRTLADGLRTGSAGRLRIGFVASVLNWGLALRLREFREANPGVEVTATQMPVADQLQALAENHIDIGFTLARVTYNYLDVQVISVEPLVATLPTGHPYADCDVVDLKDLADETFLGHRAPFGPHFDDFLMRVCTDAGFVPNVAYQGPQVHTLIHMVAAGLGVALLPRCDTRMPIPGVAFRDLAAPTPTTVLSAVHHHRYSSPIVASLLAQLPHIDID